MDSDELAQIEASFTKYSHELHKLGNPPVIVSPLSFKEKLGIPEEEFSGRKFRKKLIKLVNLLGIGAIGVIIAKSSLIASSFFPVPTFFWGLLSLGAATTPTNWAIIIGFITIVFWIFLKKILIPDTKNYEIPKYISAPLDKFALTLFDLIASLKLKMVFADASSQQFNKQEVYDQFVQDWGYNPLFVEVGLKLVEGKINNYEPETLVKNFAQFIKISKSVNSQRVKENLIKSLDEIMKIDAKIHEKEKAYFDEISQLIEKELSPSFLSRLKKKFKT